MISIVDDDQSVREATRSLLRSHGYAAVTFASAEEFLQSGLASDTSCLISDVRMAGLSGLELQRLLIDAGHRIPIIFMSAFPEERARAVAIEGGAHGFLTKPFSEHSLLSCLCRALDERDAESSGH
jgi:FixJ family two-component response regulator